MQRITPLLKLWNLPSWILIIWSLRGLDEKHPRKANPPTLRDWHREAYFAIYQFDTVVWLSLLFVVTLWVTR